MEHDKLKEAELGLRELTADEQDAVTGGAQGGQGHFAGTLNREGQKDNVADPNNVESAFDVKGWAKIK